MKNAIYVGHIGWEGTAMAIHSRNIAHLLESRGYQVSFVSPCATKQYREFGKEDKYQYYYTKQFIKIPKLRTIEWMLEELYGIKLFVLFKKILKQKKADLVLFYGYSGEKRIIDYCKKRNVRVFIDRTDWFETDDREGVFGKLFTKVCADNCIEKYDLKANGVIAISKFFYDYYSARGQKTIWIPPIFNVPKGLHFESPKASVIKLVYAGSLGGTKDIIAPVVECLVTSLNRDKVCFRLDLIGITEQELSMKFGEHNWQALAIYAHGRVAHKEAIKIVSNSDFSFLLRQNKKYAKAGFSTKFAESMCNGVPVICTEVGGADVLVQNMKNGILIKDNKKETVQNVLEDLLLLERKEIKKMKESAYDTALKYFDFFSYESEFNTFLEGNE